MALFRAFSLMKTAVLSNIRVPISYSVAKGLGSPVSLKLARGFAEGTYLDKDDVTERVIHIVKNFEKVDPGKVTPASAFQTDLGLDSLDVVELLMALEEEFAIEIPDAEADKISSCGEAINYLASHPMAK